MATISADLLEKLNNFEMPETLGFGVVLAPLMFAARFANNSWETGQLVEYGDIAILPSNRGLNYAHTLYEGMKAFRSTDGALSVFRPIDHWQRMVVSAERLYMPEVPADLFLGGLEALVHVCAPVIPSGEGKTLYLRPMLIAMDEKLGMDISSTFSFLIIASPSEQFYTGAISLLIERDHTRSAGSLGAFKVSANYAASTYASAQAKERGYDQPLWLDPLTKTNIEELSGMNFFAVINGELHTPALSGTFLAGITRDSVLTLARSAGVRVVERTMSIDQLVKDIDCGRCSEAFATGTGAGICSISKIAEKDGSTYTLPQANPLATKFLTQLQGIQECKEEDTHQWLHRVSQPITIS